MRAPVVHPHGLNQRFEFRSMDAGADVLQNAARFLDACSVRTRPPTSPPLGLHPWRRPLLYLPFKGDQTGQSEDTSAAVFRRFWGKREYPSALDYDADLRAAEHRRTPQRKRNCALPMMRSSEFSG